MTFSPSFSLLERTSSLIMIKHTIWADNYVIFHHENGNCQKHFNLLKTKPMNLPMSASVFILSSLLRSARGIPYFSVSIPSCVNWILSVYTFIILSWSLIKYLTFLKTTYFSINCLKILYSLKNKKGKYPLMASNITRKCLLFYSLEPTFADRYCAFSM